MQNTSHAVMAQRAEPSDSADDFPTPPWATRALIEYVVCNKAELRVQTCLEPACGAGHMARALKPYFRHVQSSDAFDYGYGNLCDFLAEPFARHSVDWIITNPPFRLAEEFIVKSFEIARRGIAILSRTVFLESIGRYERIFQKQRPSLVAQFTERVPMVRGRLDIKATTATGYAWLVWNKPLKGTSTLVWIPPCRKKLELLSDYSAMPHSRRTAREPSADR